MTYHAREIIALRAENTKMRDRDFAASIGISEAELVGAYCTTGEARRLRVDVPLLLEYAPSLGQIMALTRNDGAVHEVYGRFEKTFPGDKVSMTLGEIDLRIFQTKWVFAFARDVVIRGKSMRSMHFFNAQGTAVFKFYALEDTNMAVWKKLEDLLAHDDQSGSIEVVPSANNTDVAAIETPDVDLFRSKWRAMTDVHQLHGILQELKIGRHDAVKLVGEEFAQELEKDAVRGMLEAVHESQLPLMCFVANDGCVQIFTGQIGPVKMMDDWINLLDGRFHLHLRGRDIDRVWVVRKPTKDGIVSSMEVFDAKGDMIIQFFGERKEGRSELESWRKVLENLPRLSQSAVA